MKCGHWPKVSANLDGHPHPLGGSSGVFMDRSEVEVIPSPGAGSDPTLIPEQAVSFLASVSH